MSKNHGVRRLALHRETIRELQRDELRAVAGGNDTGTGTAILSLPASACPCISNGARICTRDSC